MSEATFCKYHQQIPARWFCKQCGIDFCSSCVNDQLYTNPPQCALCNEPLSDAGSEAMIPPFWHKIPLFFKIPLSLSSLIVMLALLCIGYIFTWIPIVGWLMLLIVTPAIFFKYAYLTLQNVAAGELVAPDIKILFEDSDYNIVFKQLFVFIFLFAPMTKIFGISFILGLLWYFLILFLMPATVMVLSVEQSFLKAINPLMLISFVRRIGFSYLGLYLLIMIVSGGPTIIMELLFGLSELQMNDSSVNAFAVIFYVILQMYFTLVIFSIMGYVLLKYHHRLGYEISAPIEELFGNKLKAPKIHPLLKDVEVLVKESRPIDALYRLRDRLPANANDMILRMRFHKMLFSNKKYEAMLEHASSFIQLLLNSNDKAQAVDVYRDCLTADKNFSLDGVDNYQLLAETMLQVGQYKLIVRLLNGFHKQFSDYKKIPEVYFVLARALSDGLDNDTKALLVLNFILKKYPDAAIRQQVLMYRDTVQKLATSALK